MPATNSLYVIISGEEANRRSVTLWSFMLNGKISDSNPPLHILNMRRKLWWDDHTTMNVQHKIITLKQKLTILKGDQNIGYISSLEQMIQTSINPSLHLFGSNKVLL